MKRYDMYQRVISVRDFPLRGSVPMYHAGLFRLI